MKDISKTDTKLDLQGDRVLVLNEQGAPLHVLTIIHVADAGTLGQLRLVNRESKERKPDWKLTQDWADSFEPAATNKVNAKWQVTIAG